jgi:hypothetical protein
MILRLVSAATNSMSTYQPQIASPEQVQEEFETAATKFAVVAEDVYTPEGLEGTLASLRDKTLITTYTQHLSLVHRFVVAEMDTDAPSKRGIGRLADGDPPPRLGAKFRKQLRDQAAQRDIGLAAERLVLSGFAAQAAFYEEALQERHEEETWQLWLRHLSAYYNDTFDLTERAKAEEQSSIGVTGAMMITLADHGGSELMEGYETHGVIKKLRRINNWHNARALTYFILLVGAGRALHHVLSDKVDESFGSLQSLHLLEDYAEKRNKRQMIAEV